MNECCNISQENDMSFCAYQKVIMFGGGKNLNKNFQTNFERIFIPHFYSQFHDPWYEKFIICSEAKK